jgi:uncharacterized membrane protein YkoI
MVSTFSRGFYKSTGLVVATVITISLYAVTPIKADSDQHDVQRAIDSGEVVPMQQLFAQIRREFGGRILKVELEQEHYEGNLRWIYEAKILMTNGHVLELYYDAQNLELLNREGSYQDDD